jgi:hypothetical protein
MEFTDVLSLIALLGIITVVLHGIDDRDVWPDPRPSRFELGWPRGVQEEEPIHFRTDIAKTREARGTRR